MERMSDEPEIRVKDKRRFTSDGEPIEIPETPETPDATGATEEEEPSASAQAAGAEAAASESAARADQPPPAEPDAPSQSAADAPSFEPPPASMELLVYSLVMQAEMSLMGEGEKQAPNLPMARHAIDMLGVIKDKTKGNLSLEESRLLENSLTELRFRFVQRQGELTNPGGGN